MICASVFLWSRATAGRLTKLRLRSLICHFSPAPRFGRSVIKTPLLEPAAGPKCQFAAGLPTDLT
jgi:hypothetical protein